MSTRLRVLAASAATVLAACREPVQPAVALPDTTASQTAGTAACNPGAHGILPSTLISGAAQRVTVKVVMNGTRSTCFPWRLEVSGTPPYVTAAGATGPFKGSRSIAFNVANNQSPTGMRQITFNIMRTDVKPARLVGRVTLQQSVDAPTTCSYQFDERVLVIPAAGGAVQLRVIANDRRCLIYDFIPTINQIVNWPAGIDEPAVAVSVDPFAPVATLTLSAPANNTGFARGRHVTLLASSVGQFAIQYAQRTTGGQSLSITPQLSADANSQYQSARISAPANAPWVVTPGFTPFPAIPPSGHAGTGTRTQDILVPLNSGTSPREGLAWLRAGIGLVPYDFTVVAQSAARGPMVASPITRADLVLVHRLNTPSGQTEVVVLDATRQFSATLFRMITSLHVTGPSWRHFVSDYDADGLPDLVSIAGSGTASGKVEIHVLSGRSGYTQYIAHIVTALHPVGSNVDIDLADMDRDGLQDAVFVFKSGTGSGRTEVHALSRASNFQQFVLQVPTMFGPTDPDWTFVVRDGDGDGRAELWGIHHRNTVSGRVELVLAYGYTNFDRQMYAVTTSIPANNPALAFALGNLNADAFWDFYVLDMGHSSGQQQLQVLDGAAGLGQVTSTFQVAASTNAGDWAFLSAGR